MHGSQALIASGTENQWNFVRSHLDGLWGNAADFSSEQQVALWSKIASRNLLGIRALDSSPRDVDTWVNAERLDDTLTIDQEALALYTNDPRTWNGKSMASAIERYVTQAKTDGDNAFTEMWTGWGISNFSDDPDRDSMMTDDALKALNSANGLFVECGADTCATSHQKNFLNAVTTAHSKGQHFMWFANTGDPEKFGSTGALKRFQDTYKVLQDRGLWHTNDVVMVMNYSGRYPALPETVNGQPADTITGMLYWALQQG